MRTFSGLVYTEKMPNGDKPVNSTPVDVSSATLQRGGTLPMLGAHGLRRCGHGDARTYPLIPAWLVKGARSFVWPNRV